MRSVIYGVIFTAFLASVGTVHAANDLDGKALLYTAYNKATTYPVYGLVFDKGKVSKWQVKGYSKNNPYSRKYLLKGTKTVQWAYLTTYLTTKYLNRETLKIGYDQCSISSKTEIFQKLDEIIATAKKKNKL
jgi:hypothetical protein